MARLYVDGGFIFSGTLADTEALANEYRSSYYTVEVVAVG